MILCTMKDVGMKELPHLPPDEPPRYGRTGVVFIYKKTERKDGMAAKSQKSKGGKPSKYEALRIADRLDSIRGWARHGSTMSEIAEMLGVAESTFYAWKGKYPEFAEAIRVPAQEANGEILNSAFRQAVGYRETVQEVIKVKREFVDPTTGRILRQEVPEVVEYEKYFEPVPLMTRFMMINRLAKDYKAAPVADEEKNTVLLHHVPRPKDGE